MTKITWKGFLRDLTLHPEVQADVNRRGEAIAKACGDGYEYRPPTRNQRRDRGIILATTVKAKRSNLKNMTILKNLGAGRD